METDDSAEAPALVVEVIEPKARLTKEDEEGFREVLSTKEMKQRKDKAKQSSAGKCSTFLLPVSNVHFGVLICLNC